MLRYIVDASTLLEVVVFAILMGCIYQFIFRKLTALLQGRRGPLVLVYRDLWHLMGITRIFQPLYDVGKLLAKNTIIPGSAFKPLYVASPILALFFAVLSTVFIPLPGIPMLSSLEHSLSLTVLFLALYSSMVFIGGAASSSPWSAAGAKREIIQFAFYETTLVLSAFLVAVTCGSFSILQISMKTRSLPLLITNPFAALLFLLACTGKLHIKPYDVPEAEPEVVAGPYTEYGGKLLALFLAARLIIVYTCISLFSVLFLSMGLFLPVNPWLSHIFFSCLAVIALTILHALSPRFRGPGAVAKSFLILMAIFAVLGAALAAILSPLYAGG